MNTGEVGDARKQARQWLDDGEHVLEVLRTILSDYNHMSDRLGDAEAENAKLRLALADRDDLWRRLEAAEIESARLRTDLGQCMADLDRHAREREEIADQLSQVMNEILAQLRGRRISGSTQEASAVSL